VEADVERPAILNAQPITFNYVGSTETRLGFAAEQLATLDPKLVNFNAAGQPESVSNLALLAHLLDALKWLDARLRALEAER
jgi:hypothetical protein